MKKSLLPYMLIGVIMLVISCASSNFDYYKNTPFKELDSLQSTKKVVNFSFGSEINDWKTYDKREVKTGFLSFYKKIEDKRVDSSYATVNIIAYNNDVKKRWKETTNIENYLERFIALKEKWRFKDFKYSLHTTKHKKYGKLYIVKYGDERKYKYTNVVFLFFYRNKGYTIEYSALNEHYDKFLPEVEKLVMAFKINE